MINFTPAMLSAGQLPTFHLPGLFECRIYGLYRSAHTTQMVRMYKNTEWLDQLICLANNNSIKCYGLHEVSDYPIELQCVFLVPGLVADWSPGRLAHDCVVQFQNSADLI